MLDRTTHMQASHDQWAAADKASPGYVDWPAKSTALAELAADPRARRALAIFGFAPIMRPTWIYVARTASSQSSRASWYGPRWKRLVNQGRAERPNQRAEAIARSREPQNRDARVRALLTRSRHFGRVIR